MDEISLHILDIAKNSVRAEAKLIEIDLDANYNKNLLSVKIKDNGCGMSKELLEKVCDPFATTRNTRRVGMGLALFKQAAVITGGGLEIMSQEGAGTEVKAEFVLDSLDRIPVGDFMGSCMILVSGSPEIDFFITVTNGDKSFIFDTVQIKRTLDSVAINEPEILEYLKDYFSEGYNAVMDKLI